ncbi:MAG: ferredoxin [Nonlabens sp.]|jgi:2Fe-2S ferredoxin|uniref:2Fe-2S iron-sulfur cluster-binding protein n=1 Tax=Nonlabens sp. MB-3u-79 TaxID=2058134 RepID=UPI000C3167C7|nr:2Fe-2S iron-sulfur cluster-binding protein [Nonlabens sp. MB-3u-79]AUC79032.1 ferredoxin [Nonlabens sp. MB-3u-79]|tara:strand:+ start:11396 stop:11716 length:321 start_codon:yes stop_codon:yes gene_type:complete
MSDVNITIIDRVGAAHQVLAPTDMNMNLMEVCKAYELPVQAVCGGMAMCATCQCYIISDHDLGERNDDEQAMLWEAENVKDNSRLGCQVPITEDLEGLIVQLAPED